MIDLMSSFLFLFSIIGVNLFIRALAIIAPSAYLSIIFICSFVETPKPTNTGIDEVCLIISIISRFFDDNLSLEPVTPVELT